ncbi:hypothetical protein [Hyphomicrobium sp.]|uniref:hypothetical protein n=1 Tax=Hyphomicrobium sp. TaxID=82 RepID=UPI000FA6D35A|nr:hypothetical protein [Hyphomicrobium sp.]RUP00122.1 MAG: hypothetical protein EKK30_03130 [Hyphomicrobium sp.]
MASEEPNPPKAKHDLTSRRAFLLAAYIFVLVILARLYWPGWPFPDKPRPSASSTAAPSNSPVPQN